MTIDERRHCLFIDSEHKYSSLPIAARKTTASDILNATKSSSSTSQLTKQMAPVWELIFGCHILVMNFIFGGSKGYSLGISMSTSKTPPSYGVPSGPVMVPTRCRHPGLDGTRMSSAAQMAMTPDESGLHIAAISFATLPAEVIVFC